METLQDIFHGSSSKEVDYIQYSIYIPLEPQHSDNDDHSTTAVTQQLQDTLDMIHSHIQPYVQSYIWQKDRFHLSIVHDASHDPPYPFLYGISRFGDCINDEWFIVYLLLSISLQFPHTVISLLDNDGDVLLIEAALHLPPWLDPSNSQNRVYLHQGRVCIIPLPSSPADIFSQLPTSSSLLSRQQAIHYIRNNNNSNDRVWAGKEIQQDIQDRVAGYPEAAKQELHGAKCVLPNKAIFVLLSEPALITMAIEAFYLRDPIALKACATMQTFNPGEGMAEAVVQFTRTTFAQTMGQKFYAPKPFRLPSVRERKQFKMAELGMKVACGLEMLYHEQPHAREGADEMGVDGYEFDTDSKFISYKRRLTSLGYFREEREGSALYKTLERQCKEQYLEYYKHQNSNVGGKIYVDVDNVDVDDKDTFKYSSQVLSKQIGVRQRIDELLAIYSDDALEQLIKLNSTKEEDSEEWLNVDPKQLEDLLMKRMGHTKENMMHDLQNDFGSGGGEEEVDLEKMMSNLESFVQDKSGVEGVEFPRDKANDEEEDDESDDSYDPDEYDDEEDEGAAIQFDMEKFMSILNGSSLPKEEEKNFDGIMEEMDQEVNSHDKLGASFEKLKVVDQNEDEEEDVGAPVDIQLNLVKNVLESFKSQQGLPGPVGNLLGQFGFMLPGDNEEEE